VKHFLNECRSHLRALAGSAAIGLTMLGIAYTAAPARVAVTAVARSPIAAAEAPAPAVIASDDGRATTTEPGWDLPNLDHERVDYWVSRFTTHRRDDFSVFLRRMATYEPMIASKLAARGMPQDLIYLAMIESGFNPNAYSPAHAAGLWQYLAAAAYNTGENRVGRILREVTGSEKGTEEAYYAISPRLPQETRDYVPMMVAAARIAKEPEKYGFASQSS
jgi:membrane-bound lytic murein transglycosylase D